MARRAQRSQSAKICGCSDPYGVPVYSKANYRKFLQLLALLLLGDDDLKMDPLDFLSFVRRVRDQLSFFLEMIDRCDVLYAEKDGERLVFLVLTDNVEHLPLIRNAIASERAMLDELGIDPREIDVHRDMIRISVPVPDAASSSLN